LNATEPAILYGVGFVASKVFDQIYLPFPPKLFLDRHQNAPVEVTAKLLGK
jgi:hypothetical protein